MAVSENHRLKKYLLLPIMDLYRMDHTKPPSRLIGQ